MAGNEYIINKYKTQHGRIERSCCVSEKFKRKNVLYYEYYYRTKTKVHMPLFTEFHDAQKLIRKGQQHPKNK